MTANADGARRVLVVDDDKAFRRALERYLIAQGHFVTSATHGDEALEILRGDTSFELMLLDVNMPGVSGFDIVSEALDVDPHLAIIMLSGLDDAISASVSLQRGAMDYLVKPIDLTDLSYALDRAFRRRETRIQDGEISSWLHEELANRARELEREQQRLKDVSVATLEALVAALEAKDPYLAGHSARVASLSATIASELGLDDDEVERIRTAGRLHDLGKIGIRESILNKTDDLTADEYDHIKQHVTIGSQILAPLQHLGSIIEYVRGHHERWDGSGYPDGLAGDAIPLGARIIGAAEIYDALTTERAYQKQLSPQEATDRMRLFTGQAVDPAVMEALDAAVSRRQTLIFIEDD